MHFCVLISLEMIQNFSFAEMETKSIIAKIMDSDQHSPSPDSDPPKPPAETRPISPTSKREHQKLYQREYRKKQKEMKTQLQQNQVKGSELIMITSDGEISSQIMKTEDDYIQMLEGFLESLKAKKYLISWRISRESAQG